MSLSAFCEWLATTPWSIALHESLYVYPWIESTHVLSICLFVGTLVFFDLRLLSRIFYDVPLSEVTTRILPWTLAGFLISIATGTLLFYAIPVRTYHSVFFRLKIGLLIIAGINAWLFHRRLKQNLMAWDVAQPTPVRVRVAAAVSLGCWACVIVLGRMIAYNWFDCDRQPQPELVNWFASCVVEVHSLLERGDAMQ